MMRSSSRGSRSPTARCAPSAAWTSPRAQGACSACSARTAPARPPRCGSSPRCSSPTPARARVAGLDVVRDAAALRARIGLAGQYAAVDENLTGFENLEMVGRLYHLGKAQSRQRADELLERFELTDAAKRPAKTYSGGMRRRLDLAAALVARRRPVPRRADHRPRPAQPASACGRRSRRAWRRAPPCCSRPSTWTRPTGWPTASS